jgi:lipopolysaccharide biosynthesis protein
MVDDVRAIAFYLPQYYPTAENDAWWGRGFTEWSKVVEGRPLFHGHYQPQLPADLGFYDLRVPEVRQAQAQLARQHGIHGFCYYHYWLDGRRLLDRPFAEVLATGKPDFPFCLCWANHNWTRRWDGLNSEVLIAQNHTPAGDRAMIRELMPAFRDPRYIRVKGRPLFLVYRASELSDPRAVAQAWREEAVAAGLPGLYLVRAEVHDDAHTQQDPAQIGFDAAYEFPPHGIRVATPSSATPGLDPAFSGLAYEYAEVARDFATRPTPNYRRFHAVMPSWDNTARVGRRAHMAVNSSPEAYRSWLEIVANRTRREQQGDERLVFINGWNEWAEGCHLEPDRRYGLAWLEATRAALSGTSPEVSHDPSQESPVPLYARIERLAEELGLEGASPELVLREASALARRWSADVARRDDVIVALNEKLVQLTTSLAQQQRGDTDRESAAQATAERLAS